MTQTVPQKVKRFLDTKIENCDSNGGTYNALKLKGATENDSNGARKREKFLGTVIESCDSNGGTYNALDSKSATGNEKVLVKSDSNSGQNSNSDLTKWTETRKMIQVCPNILLNLKLN